MSCEDHVNVKLKQVHVFIRIPDRILFMNCSRLHGHFVSDSRRLRTSCLTLYGTTFFSPSLPVQDETPHLLKPELLPEAQYACVVSYIAVKFIYIHAPCGKLSGYYFTQTVPVHHRLPLC